MEVASFFYHGYMDHPLARNKLKRYIEKRDMEKKSGSVKGI
jgi:hypothetical protein